MIGIIVASHGEFAKGLLMSAEMIMGKQDNVAACSLFPSESPEDLKKKIIEVVKAINCEELLFLVDLWGGTPFHQISALIETHTNWNMVVGMNLPMLIDALLSRDTFDTAQALREHVLDSGKEGIRQFPENTVNQKERFVNSTQQLLRKGHMEYVLVRIDSRLLHGQVATSWTKSCSPDRIIVVSDEVAYDALRKKMIKQAAPSGVKAHVIPISKLVELDRDDRFGGVKVLLLFENVQDVVKAIEMGVRISHINVGSIAHQEGKVTVNDALAMDLEDVQAFEKLLKLQIRVEVQKVPSDSVQQIEALLRKAKILLKEEV